MGYTVAITEQSHKVDFNQLHAFYWVVKSGTFSSAAKFLGVPKSTVSRHVSALERRLGTRLIERTTRRAALTEIGMVFFAHCERVVSEVEEAEQAVATHTAAPRGLLRIGAPITFAQEFLAPLLPQFCRKYPDVKLELVMRGGAHDSPKAALDIIINVGRLEDSSLVVRKLGTMKQGIYASAAYLAGHPPPTTVAELANDRLITRNRSPNDMVWKLSGPTGKIVDVRVDPYVATGDVMILRHLIVSGIGIGVLPAFLTRNDDRLVPVLPEWQPQPLDFFALYSDRQLSSPKVRVFLDELAAKLRL